MLIALSGVTGVGKTYYTDIISKELKFNKVNTIRTRPKRESEENQNSGYFMTNEQLDKMKKEGKIIYDFSVFNGRYAYLKEEILSDKNYIFEMHYTMIDDWKKIIPQIKTIYIFPKDIQMPKKMLKKRGLTKEQEQYRENEIDEQYSFVKNNKNFQKKFDYIIYNDYSEKTKNEIIELVSKIVGE